MRTLVVTTDPLLVSAFREASGQLGIESRTTASPSALSQELSCEKYCGVVLDCDTLKGLSSSVYSVRKSKTNPNAVIFVFASEPRNRDEALFSGAHFVLHRPIDSEEIRQTLSAAYDLMQRERRRYFRSIVELPVTLKRLDSGAVLQCTTVNVSSDGLGITSEAQFHLAETVDYSLTLSDGFSVLGTGIVIWDDKHGRAGLKSVCRTPEMRKRLDAWLDSQSRHRESR